MSCRLSPRVAWQSVQGEVVVIDLDSSQVMGLNQTGSLIWTMLAAGDDTDLAGELVRRHGVAPEQAAADVTHFLEQLRCCGLVEDGQ